MDLLLDVHIIVDLLANRQAFAQHAADVLDRSYNEGSRIWLYAGSVQTLEYVLAEELSHNESESYKLSRERARLLLNEFAADKQWLAALANEGSVFESDDQAAIVLAKLDIFPNEVAARARIGSRYTELLGNHVVTPCIAPEDTSVYAQYTVQVESREDAQKKLGEQGVPTAVHYPVPLHLQPVFAELELQKGSFPVSEAAGERVMSLPMHPYLSEDTLVSIASALREVIR